MKIRYGTRGSALALAQSGSFANDLRQRYPKLDIERVVIETSGDRFSLARPDAPASESGENVKALFVKEIEEALFSGTIDFAVHSSKDLAAEVPAGLAIVAFPQREDPRDVYIGGKNAPRWMDLMSGSKVATASLRRQIQMCLAVPGLDFVTMRGNIDTRLRKLDTGKADGLILAQAGLKRLGLNSLSREAIAVDVIVPAPGQGALAIEAKADNAAIRELLAPLDHAQTRFEVECERVFLGLMGGSCRTPLGALAQSRLGELSFRWFWSDDAGRFPQKGLFACAADASVFAAKARGLAESLSRPTLMDRRTV
jgi:hydroxymethylbilane synthase